MAFERENFYVAKKIPLEKSDLTVECNLSAGTNIAKVLAISVNCNQSGSETLNGVVNFSGAVDVKLIIMTEDGQINTVCSTCPFSSKFESETIENGQEAYIKVKVIDYNVESISGDMVKIAVVVQQSGFIICNVEVGTVSCNDDDVCVKNDEILVNKYIGMASSETTIESEINIRENIKKILLTESNAVLKSVEAGSGFVSVSGDVVTRVLYINENDKFESGYVNDTFKEEIEMANVTRESLVEGACFVKQDGCSCEIVQDEKGAKIVVKVAVSNTVLSFEETTVQVINELYSIKNELSTTTSSFSMTALTPIESIEGKISGELSLDESEPRVDKLLFSGANNVAVTNCYIKDGEVFVEGIAKATAVYLNDEDSSLHSVQLDVPFVVSDKFNVEEGGLLSADVIVHDVDVGVKKGREFYYDAKVKCSVNYSNDRAMGVLSEVNVLDEYKQKDYAMEVIFAPSGQELWDVAKLARVKQEQIIAQNPDVTFPVAEDTPLVLFYQRVR